MSRSRPRVLSRCSFQICSAFRTGRACRPAVDGPAVAADTGAPADARSRTTMRQSARASPGAATAARTRLMRRSLLVTVPSFSAQVLAGSSRSAKAQVAVVPKALLHHHKLGTPQGSPHGRLVRQRLGGVGAGDPQGADLAVGGGLEHLDRGPARRRRARRSRPTAARLLRGRPDSPGHDVRSAGWPCRRLRARPWRWAGRSATAGQHRAARSGRSRGAG